MFRKIFKSVKDKLFNTSKKDNPAKPSSKHFEDFVMKLQLTHQRLLVSNYKDSFLFYRDLLGFDVDWGDENSGYAELFFRGDI